MPSMPTHLNFFAALAFALTSALALATSAVATETADKPAAEPRISTPPRVCNLQTKRCYHTLFEGALRLQDNQTLELQPGRYVKDVAVVTARNVTLRVAKGGQAVLDPVGRHAFGKGTLVTTGSNITIEGFTFLNARVPHRNGAGIRHEGGDLTIRNCRFLGNEMGIITNNHPTAHVQIIDSEFARSTRVDHPTISLNGYPAHNIYIGQIERLTLRGVWSHATEVGHALKSRARHNDIEASYFSSRAGTGSYEAEFPSGGNVRFVGNIVEQGVGSRNTQMLAIGFEFSRYPSEVKNPRIEISQNTFINHNALLGAMVSIRNARDYVPTTQMMGNIWAGPGRPRDAENIALALDDFESVERCDFRRRPSAVSEEGAFVPFVPSAQFEYVHPNRHQPRGIHVFGAIGSSAPPKQLCN